MDADSVSHMMHCNNLISHDDYNVISTAPNDIKMNCQIMQCVKLMSEQDLLRFCDTLNEIKRHHKIASVLQHCKLTFCNS